MNIRSDVALVALSELGDVHARPECQNASNAIWGPETPAIHWHARENGHAANTCKSCMHNRIYNRKLTPLNAATPSLVAAGAHIEMAIAHKSAGLYEGDV